MKVIIIGGGAAGLMAAYGAASSGADTLVLEKMPRPGRKIMITGKGRCNLSNLKAWNEFQAHVHPKASFLKPSFYNLTPEKMMSFLEKHGVRTVVERGDRIFPESHMASDVVDALVRAARSAGAEILTGHTVEGIDCKDGIFEVRCGKESFSADKLIITTGGLSYPKTGSSGDGYQWASLLGHRIRPCFPSLTAMVPRGYKLVENADGADSYNVGQSLKGYIPRSNTLSEIGQMLCGNQLKNVELSLFVDGNEVQSETGDLDFTDGGIEGPIGFRLSRRCVNALINGSKVYACLDMKPAVGESELHSRIGSLWDEIAKDKRSAGKQYKDRFRILLGKLLPQPLVPVFLKTNTGVDHKTLAKVLKNWRFEIAGYVGYERCVITAGGVSCEEITAKTLESRLVPGLYFAGEILDLDADTGGYNLHIAFSTGLLAGERAAQ